MQDYEHCDSSRTVAKAYAFDWAFMSNDIDEVYQADQAWEFSAIQMQPGALDFRMSHATLGGLKLSLDTQRAPVRAKYAKRDSRFSLAMVLSQSGTIIWDGKTIQNGEIVLIGSAEHDLCALGNGVRLNIEMEANLGHLSGLSALPEGIWSTEQTRFPGFVHMCLAIISQGPPNCPSVRTQTANHLISELQSCLKAPTHTAQYPHYCTFQRAESYLAACGWDRNVAIDDLTHAIGVSRRTLYRAFDDILRMGPASFARLMRLHQFHRNLKDFDNCGSVTRAALEAGFEHCGRASKYYLDHFGWRPRDLVRRAETERTL